MTESSAICSAVVTDMGASPSVRDLARSDVDEIAVVEQDEAVIPGHLEDLRRPEHAPGIVAAEDREEIALRVADILEAAEHVGRDGDEVARAEAHFGILAVLARHEAPTARYGPRRLLR